MPTRVQARLRDADTARPVEVSNLGRQWYTSHHSLINYASNLRPLRPDVVVVMHAINDVLHNADFSYFSRGPFRSAVPRPHDLLGHEAGTRQTQYAEQRAVLDANTAAQARETVRWQVARVPSEARPAALGELLRRFEAIDLPEWPTPPVTLCRVDNNVRAMALGEAIFGAGRDVRALALVYGRIGVGAGVVVMTLLLIGLAVRWISIPPIATTAMAARNCAANFSR